MGNWGAKPAARASPPPAQHIPSVSSYSSRYQTHTSYSGQRVSSSGTSGTSSNLYSSNYSSSSFVPKPSPTVTPTTTRVSSVLAKPQTPAVPEIGNQTIKHSVNDYVIPKETMQESSQINSITAPFRKIADKFLVRACPQYNSRSGCRASTCRRFHVCFGWIQGKCTKANCEADHDFTSSHNQCIASSLTSRRDYNSNMLVQWLQGNHKFSKRSKRNDLNEICMFNIMKKCNRSPCSLAHVGRSYSWEIKANNRWMQLAHEQSNVLESLYSQPEQEIVDVPPLPSVRTLQNLKSVFSKHEKWMANYTKMTIFCDVDEYEIRRLSTPTDISNMNRLATRWIWYWEDDSGSWFPYLDGCGSKFFIFALSDHLEHLYNFSDAIEEEITLGNYPYVINLSTMTQRNKHTGSERRIRRRPSCFEQKVEDIHIDQFFSSNPNDQQYRHAVPKTSPEFAYVKKLMEASLSSVNLLKVERIVNNHLWKTYQNKKRQLKVLYNNDIAAVNEQYLFHGTKHSVIDQICKDNFDWRLFGSNVGNVYGHGVYFSNLAQMSDSYSETDCSNVKIMFIVLVLVGSMTIGDRTMKFPPDNSSTGRCFDTTCNDRWDSKIFVKYNKDEYYPIYIAHYQR